MYAALRDHDPVHHVEHGDHWVLSRYEDVLGAFRDPERFSSAQGLTTVDGDMAAIGIDEAKPIVMLDPPEHTAFRRLVAKGFTPRRVEAVEPEVRAFTVERIERLRAMRSADVVAELFAPLPNMAVAHYLGVPEEDRALFGRWTEAIVAANAQGDVFTATEAVTEMFGYFTELIEWRRRHPGEDTVSDLVGLGEDTVTVLQVLGFAFTMVTGGNDTTSGLLSGSAELLTERPDQRARLQADPALLPDAIEELLRLTSPVQGLARTTTVDVQLHGRTIPAGRKVLLLHGSANRDPREWGPDADEVDVERRPKRVVAFSYGTHHCLGAAVARLQARVVLEELLARCPSFAVDAAAGRFAPGQFVRRYESLPFTADGAA
jgi:cytochrome P450